ncbi:hypothetical protein MCHIJ_32440 [Mycolicibacterium chitae]|uniref:Uncharacterized protein n=1 Tax=Mycolicibacterium chitae TaxID=1792 RepID=A0A448I4N9_MYCCI|nr:MULTISPECIES: hypothetical protein [Mycolicibacterium]MCV7106278.1 hypothetical protein [Mycolicibacterium chitae]BBZ03807.1 hypothetical protein MCHIJ_32440 [Mycolicibacterium chitae]VEG47461.1 Uncharacterised protein [Mycolicibacterium chitae]
MHNALESIRPQLDWACDALIPRDDYLGMPAATLAGLVETLLPRTLNARVDLLRPFVEAMSTLPAEPPSDPLGVLYGMDEASFEFVTRTIADAYFLSDEVNRTLKYPGPALC